MAQSYKPKFNADKFKELMLYAAEESAGDEYFGAIKLNKILFFSDFLAYGLFGEPVTGATYKREGNGPVPTQLKWMAKEIEKSHDGMFVVRPFFNHHQKRLVAHRPANPHHFSIEEKDLIDDVIRNLAPLKAIDVSILSHERSFAWQIADEGEEIPYDAVFVSARKVTQADRDRGLKLAKKYGWLASPAK